MPRQIGTATARPRVSTALTDARWLDLGVLTPRELHAAYAGLAQAQTDEASPLLLWARCDRPHLCIGASQSAPEELDPAACDRLGIEVLRRPLGGGSVWVDPHQACLFVILPHGRSPQGHPALFDLCLPPLLDVFAGQGLDARRVGGQDLWVGGRKVLGSGAATLGRAMVFGTSFLLRFDTSAFAEVIRAPSEAYREWLTELLAAGMTDWRQEGVEPDLAVLAEATRAAYARHCGWRIRTDRLREDERAAMRTAGLEMTADEEGDLAPSRRLVRHGIKVNQRTYLVESGEGRACLRAVISAGKIQRLYSGEPDLNARLQVLLGEPVDAPRLLRRLTDQGVHDAEAWVRRILTMTADIDLDA